MTFIKKTKLTTPFLSIQEIASRETIHSQAMMSDPVFSSNFKDWMAFYDDKKNDMHIFDVKSSWAESVADSMEKTYESMMAFTRKLLENNTTEELYDMFPMPGVEKSTVLKFIEYAKYTLQTEHRKIGSRFDFAISPDGQLFVYEINADTPSMLFESMNVQNLMSEHLGDTDAQYNEIWGLSESDPLVSKDSVTAVCGYNSRGEDFGTTESIAQLMENAGGVVYLTTIDDLSFDPEETQRSPFFLKCLPHVELDNIYVMLPWEEMISSEMRIMDNWEVWKDKVRFFEPAWAWFLSHKALIAYMSNGETIGYQGVSEDGSVKVAALMSASCEPDAHSLIDGVVSKPVVGRKSSGIKITQIHNGVTSCSESKDDTYGDGPFIYQPYRPTMKIDGCRVMGTMWMYGETAACLSFREFDSDILENDNERVIMHRLVD